MQAFDTKKLLGMLGLASRARKLVTGTELVTEAVRRYAPHPADHRKKAANGIVLIAADASENTTKRIENCCTHYGVCCCRIPIEKGELAHAIGKMADTAVCGVFEKGFVAALQKISDSEVNRKAPIMEERKVSETESDAGGIAYDNE